MSSGGIYRGPNGEELHGDGRPVYRTEVKEVSVLSDSELAKLIELEAKATPGPWSVDWVECPDGQGNLLDKWPERVWGKSDKPENGKVCTFGEASDYHRHSNINAALIVALRNAFPAIVAALRSAPPAPETATTTGLMLGVGESVEVHGVKIELAVSYFGACGLRITPVAPKEKR
jgi:hypothetical protein